MKILYKPFGIIASLIGAKIAKSVFKALWTRIDQRRRPSRRPPDASFQKVVGAAALEAATMAAIGAAVDRASARTFHHLTGIWPGERRARTGAGQKPRDRAARAIGERLARGPRARAPQSTGSRPWPSCSARRRHLVEAAVGDCELRLPARAARWGRCGHAVTDRRRPAPPDPVARRQPQRP